MYQYKVLPFVLSLSERMSFHLLRELGIRILNYLNDWLILSRDLASPTVGASGQLGIEQILPHAEHLFS